MGHPESPRGPAKKGWAAPDQIRGSPIPYGCSNCRRQRHLRRRQHLLMSGKVQKIVGVERPPDQIEQLVPCRNAPFGIRRPKYHVESCIESLVDPVLEFAFLDLERERPHFIVELGTALVLILVIHALQDVAVMTRREYQNAGLHDMVSAPGESPETVIILRVEIGLPDP